MNIIEMVEKYASLVHPVAKAVHENPELGFEEYEAARLRVELLRSAGFQVTAPYGAGYRLSGRVRLRRASVCRDVRIRCVAGTRSRLRA